MSLFLRVCSLSLGMVLATYVPSTAQSLTTMTPQEIKSRGADWLGQCLQDWDAATHMTKTEWAHTCRRVVDDRVKWLFDQSKQ